jgi:phenylpropionate dioxygenase-like ring-hydroxylating dioxygenase large terminal subunit
MHSSCLGAERHAWHPVLRADALAVRGVQACALLGERVVLWRDASAAVHAWRDQCPHRGAQLSLGRVVAAADGTDRLQCAYHGWQFDGAALCQNVPAQPQWKPSAGHCAKRFACHEHLGLIWVNLDASATWRAPRLPWASDAGLTHALAGPYAVASSAPRLVENFLDMTHFGFIHPGYLGDADHTEMPAYEVQESADGLIVPQCSAWQPQAFDEGQATGQQVNYRYEVISPYCVALEKISATGDQALNIAMLNCPVNAESAITWFLIASAGLNQTPQQMIAFQTTIFAQDQPIVESQMPKALPLESGEVHGPLDKVSAAYRRYLLKAGVVCGTVRS